ncbi:hypothetical protein XELAEV_18002847mg [Xenopus laevis]|nr:hypothetical protein XELAEV_18002847mg [Xenopus laevis]
MASQSAGIQQLLQAEKRAAERVAEARKMLSISDVAAIFLQALGSHGSCLDEVEKETTDKMSIIQQNYAKNRETVLENLLSFVCDIKPEIHLNYRVNG